MKALLYIFTVIFLLGAISTEEPSKAFSHYDLDNIIIWWVNGPEKTLTIVLENDWSMKHKILKVKPTDTCQGVYTNNRFFVFTLCHIKPKVSFYVDPTPYSYKTPWDTLWVPFAWGVLK